MERIKNSPTLGFLVCEREEAKVGDCYLWYEDIFVESITPTDAVEALHIELVFIASK